MTRYRISIGRFRMSYGVLVAALLGACSREPPGSACSDAGSESAEVVAEGKLVLDWNKTAFDVAKRAHDYKDPFPHLRALTMMHLAVHDAVNGVTPKYARHALAQSDEQADPVAAAAAAAHGVLLAVYPGQRALLDAKLEESTRAAQNDTARDRGLALGKAAAQAVLATRADDGSNAPDRYAPGKGPGRYQFVPPFDLVYRPAWRSLAPFALASPDQYRSKPPPGLESPEYAQDYEEVKAYGSARGSTRTAEQTFYADWWYELSEIGWNRIARATWTEQSNRDLWFTARLFALVNVGLMDAYIAGWDSKLHYDFWRPYTAIRAGTSDGNPATAADATWEPYCITPPVQDYPSTHSALGAAAATILRHVYGRNVPFAMESSSSKPPGQKRSFTSFERAAEENADSRVACGIHFRFATRAGLELGKRVGEHVIGSSLLPSRSASLSPLRRR